MYRQHLYCAMQRSPELSLEGYRLVQLFLKLVDKKLSDDQPLSFTVQSRTPLEAPEASQSNRRSVEETSVLDLSIEMTRIHSVGISFVVGIDHAIN